MFQLKIPSHPILARVAALVIVASLAAPAVSSAADANASGNDRAAAAIVETLNAAQKAQRGVTLWVGGQTVAGGVVRLDESSVELRNQTHSRIVVRLARIDAAAW